MNSKESEQFVIELTNKIIVLGTISDRAQKSYREAKKRADELDKEFRKAEEEFYKAKNELNDFIARTIEVCSLKE